MNMAAALACRKDKMALQLCASRYEQTGEPQKRSASITNRMSFCAKRSKGVHNGHIKR